MSPYLLRQLWIDFTEGFIMLKVVVNGEKGKDTN